MKVTGTVYTVGHSNHDPRTFVAILDRCRVGLLVDVRSHPGSRRCPWFNRATMVRGLGTRYYWLGNLGGPMHGPYAGRRFPKHHIAQQREPVDDKPTWTNQGLWDYGVWMASPQFRAGLQQLATLVEKFGDERVAICCAEVHWWRCHRSMIADAWVGCGGQAIHLWPNGKETDHAGVLGNRLERYEDATRALWLDSR